MINVNEITEYTGSWIKILNDGSFIHILTNRNSLSIKAQNEMIKILNILPNQKYRFISSCYTEYYMVDDTNLFLNNRKQNKNNRIWFYYKKGMPLPELINFQIQENLV